MSGAVAVGRDAHGVRLAARRVPGAASPATGRTVPPAPFFLKNHRRPTLWAVAAESAPCHSSTTLLFLFPVRPVAVAPGDIPSRCRRGLSTF